MPWRQSAAVWLKRWTLSIWWGGLTVYAAVVVPLGSERFGATEQGMLTQQVTHFLNAAGLLALAAVLPAVRQANAGAARRRWVWGIAVACQILLLALHFQLDRLLEESPGDDVVFYRWHQAYLWCTTLMWLAGGWLVADDPG